MGETDAYRFTAKAAKNNGQLQVMDIEYVLKYRKRPVGGSETVEEKPYSIMGNVVRQQKKPYFTEDDVFTYVLRKAKADKNFVKASPNAFASRFSASGKFLGNRGDLFDMTKIQKYIDLYSTKDENEHLAAKITAGLYNAKNGTINANDSEGTLILQYCVTTEEAFAEHLANVSERSITAISEPVTKSGFRKADADTLKALFEFKSEKQIGYSAKEAQAEWKKYQFPSSSYNWPLLLKGSQAKSFPSLNNKKFRITINAVDTPQNFFAVETATHLSKGSDGAQILLEGVVLQKTADTTDLTVTFLLSDGKTIDVLYPHTIH